MRLVFAIIISFVFLSSCKDKNKEYAPLNKGPKAHQIKVKEVLQASTYTYLFVNENKEDYWIAVSKVDKMAGIFLGCNILNQNRPPKF